MSAPMTLSLASTSDLVAELQSIATDPDRGGDQATAEDICQELAGRSTTAATLAVAEFRIGTSTDLVGLLDVILALPDGGMGADEDLSALPTFGGEEPAGTAGIYSWDATRLLVGPGAADHPDRPFAIVARDEVLT